MDKTHNTNSPTPYDDVHRTMLNECPSLLIPLVNEVFQENYKKDEKVNIFNDTFYINVGFGTQAKIISDSNLEIQQMRYHLEIESTVSGEILLRVAEYAFQIALQSSELTDEGIRIRFPRSAVIYLRHTHNTPDKWKTTIETSESECSYYIPVIKSQSYTIDEIFEKELFYLLPFYIFTHEKHFKLYEKNPDALETFNKKRQVILLSYLGGGMNCKNTQNTCSVRENMIQYNQPKRGKD